MSQNSPELRLLGTRAAEQIADGNVVGLGSGRAATEFIRALGERVRHGLKVRGVPTSEASAQLARELGIPLVDMTAVDTIDVDVDGADEVDPQGNLIKGFGGALLREKIVAAASRKIVILIGAEKLVPVLGSRGKLPVEVVPFGVPFCQRRLAALGCVPDVRLHDGRPFITDNGNQILDCRISALEHPDDLERRLRAIPGVVGTGLFLGMADEILIQTGTTVEARPCTRRTL